MNELVVAVYKSASAAEAAVEDIKVARVPSATIRQFVSDPAAQESLLELHNRTIASGDSVVTVTVEDGHASAVMGILDMQAPVCMTEAATSYGVNISHSPRDRAPKAAYAWAR
jgi:hypothetical protein